MLLKHTSRNMRMLIRLVGRGNSSSVKIVSETSLQKPVEQNINAFHWSKKAKLAF